MHINNLIYVSYIKNINSKKILTNTFLCLGWENTGNRPDSNVRHSVFNMFPGIL